VEPGVFDDLNRISSFYSSLDDGLAERVESLNGQGISGLADFPGPYRFPCVPIAAFSHFREAYLPFGKDGFVLRFEIIEERGLIVVYRVHHTREDRFFQ
tara:strand:- start:168769 stop:169065 length:297 start_codon:yes stop_codon:yes gene_type:complete